MLSDRAMPGRAADRASLLFGRYLAIVLRLVAKVIVGVLAVVVVALLVGFIAWDVLVFQAQRPSIDQLIASATEEERNPPETVVRLVRTEASQRVASRTYWVLVGDPTNPTNRAEVVSSLPWQTRRLLWWTCLWLHLSERDQITLIVSRSYMGQDMTGFSAASQAVFNRPLALLSLEEAATLVAIPHCASCFHNKRKGWDVRRDYLLSRLQPDP